MRLATYHFSGQSSLWLQSQKEFSSWIDLCNRLGERFGRDQYQDLIRQLFKTTQTLTVAEYMAQFEPLMNRIVAHNPSYEPVFFTTKFVDRHCDDIRFMILLHRPKDLDTAYALASLQESNRSGFRGGLDKGEVQNYTRSVNRVQASPFPPPRLTLGGSSSDCRVSISKMDDDKFSAMKAYRRARG